MGGGVPESACVVPAAEGWRIWSSSSSEFFEKQGGFIIAEAAFHSATCKKKKWLTGVLVPLHLRNIEATCEGSQPVHGCEPVSCLALISRSTWWSWFFWMILTEIENLFSRGLSYRPSFLRTNVITGPLGWRGNKSKASYDRCHSTSKRNIWSHRRKDGKYKGPLQKQQE